MVNSINTNIAAYFAQTNIALAANSTSQSVARLSSGNRIIKASDDVAGLSIGTSLRSNVSTLRVAKLNTSLGTSLLQVADGGLSQISEILQRQKALSVQASSGSLSATQRGFLNQEFQQLVAEIDRIATGTNFNGVSLLNGALTSTGSFITSDPAANTNFAFTMVGDSSSNPVISANAVVVASDGTNGYNPNVIGNIENVTFTNVGATDNATAIQMRMTINGVLFQGVADASGLDATDSNETVAFTLEEVGPTFNDSDGSTNDPMRITITFQENTATAVSSLATFMTAAGTAGTTILEGSYISQQRNLTGYATASQANTVLAGVSAAPVFTTNSMDTATGDTFGNVSSISVTRVGDAADANGAISAVVNGFTYSLANLAAITDSSDGILDAGDVITLTRVYDDPDLGASRTETIAYTLTGLTTSVNLNTVDGAQALEDALKQVFGVSTSGNSGGINFQVGVNSTDSLTVAIDDVQTTELYASATLDVLTSGAATTATDALDVAINAVTAARAGVGALQSRFNFASANIDSSIQNQDAARGELLDTDVAAEATMYATSQVKLQAGISVLAQANQQLQSLLKLIG
jgi:flagellin